MQYITGSLFTNTTQERLLEHALHTRSSSFNI